MHFQPQMHADAHRYKSKPTIRFSSAFICVHLWLIACLLTVPAYATETITVAVASSLYADMQVEAKAFEKEHDVTIRLVAGSTGRLYNQIMQGAPFDLFIAADKQRPELLAHHGKALEVYKVGQGYLGVMVGNRVLIDPERLTDPSIRQIAIANPDVAPFGQVSKTLLNELKLWSALKHKFVYAQNAMQVSMLVNKGLVDAGFVPVSAREASLATIQYHCVLLVDRVMARQWMNSLSALQNSQLALRNP